MSVTETLSMYHYWQVISHGALVQQSDGSFRDVSTALSFAGYVAEFLRILLHTHMHRAKKVNKIGKNKK